MSATLYREITDKLRASGFELVRHGKHAIWKSPDNQRGVAVGKNIRDKNLARALLRSAGITDIRL